MTWWESVKTFFADGGCLPRLGRRAPDDLYSYPPLEPAGKQTETVARRRRCPGRGGRAAHRGGAGGGAAGDQRANGQLRRREAGRGGVLRQGVQGDAAERQARRGEAAGEAVQARLQRRLPPAAVGGVQAAARELRPPARIHRQRRPPRARLRVRHHGHPPRRPARAEGSHGGAGGRGREAGAELGAQGADRAGLGEGPGVPAREGVAGGDAQGRALHQRAALRRHEGQDRGLQHVQPGRRHGATQPLRAHARLLRLPGARVRHVGPDDRQERRVQLRHRSSRAPHGKEAVGPDVAAGAAKPGQLGISTADRRQSSGMHRPEARQPVPSYRSSEAWENRGAVPPVRPHLPAVHGHHRPRDQLRRRAGPAGRCLMIVWGGSFCPTTPVYFLCSQAMSEQQFLPRTERRLEFLVECKVLSVDRNNV